MARHGRNVVGADISPNGIRGLENAAKQENFVIECIVADISAYGHENQFDIILIDRTRKCCPRQSVLRI